MTITRKPSPFGGVACEGVICLFCGVPEDMASTAAPVILHDGKPCLEHAFYFTRWIEGGPSLGMNP